MKETYTKIGERWVNGKQCPCGQIFNETPLHVYDPPFAPEVCPKCGASRNAFKDGAVLIEHGETRGLFGIKKSDNWKLKEFKEF